MITVRSDDRVERAREGGKLCGQLREVGQRTPQDEMESGVQCEGYWGLVSGEEAERILTRESDGRFEVQRKDHGLALTVRLKGKLWFANSRTES